MRGENKFLRIIQVSVLLFCISFDYCFATVANQRSRYCAKVGTRALVPRPWDKGDTRSQKFFFSAHRASVWFKNKGGWGRGRGGGRSLAPPLDLPLGFSFKIDFHFFWSCSGQFRSVSEILFFVFTVYWFKSFGEWAKFFLVNCVVLNAKKKQLSYFFKRSHSVQSTYFGEEPRRELA